MPITCKMFAAALGLLAIASGLALGQDSISLAGTWRVELEGDAAHDSGAQKFAAQAGEVRLPGSVQEQGYGELPSARSPWTGHLRQIDDLRYEKYLADENYKMPFWLTPHRVFVGAARFERDIEIPADWAGRRVTLHLERPHWLTTAWLDGKVLGTRDSLSVPHVYDLGAVEPGRHRLAIRVDNSDPTGVGINAHSVSDHTQTNWNGIAGRIELRARPHVYIESLRVTPNAAKRTAIVFVKLTNTNAEDASARLALHTACEGTPDADVSLELVIAAGRTTGFKVVIDLGAEAALWDEFIPSCYELTATLDSAAGTDTFRTWFGLRDLAADGTRFTLNGRSIFLRGTLDCCIYPLTGYPPMDVAAWKRVFERVKEFGLNHVRYHSWCPPRAAFIAADRLGIYLQVEGPFWVHHGSALGLGRPIDDYVYAEIDRILEEYGNHPSFLLMSHGNEPAGPGAGGVFLSKWLEHVKKRDPRRLYTSGSGWPIIEESQFHVSPHPRIQRWGEGLRSRINAEPPSTDRDFREYVGRYGVPVVSHEIGEWCVFPDFDEMAKYTGSLKPKNFEIFRDLLEDAGLGHRARDFLMASGRFQVECYKEEIETALRTPGFGGFQLLDLHDFPGQGTALVGVLDPFWDPKPYVTAQEFRSFCGPVTPLARMERRIFADGDEFRAGIEISQFGRDDLKEASVSWSLATDDGKTLASGTFGPIDLPAGELVPVGTLEHRISAPRAMRAVLRVSIDGTGVTNSWNVWFYPCTAEVDAPGGVQVVHELDEEAEKLLDDGQTVLVFVDPRRVRGEAINGFSPVFWNTAWTNNQPPHTLGIFLNPEHPLFAHFPTSHHSDWQWWELIAKAGAMVVNDLPVELEPLVQPIDTWFRSHKLTTLFEVCVGRGRVVMCSMDLESDLENRHAARQFRNSLMRYLESDDFAPCVSVGIDELRALYLPPSPMQRMGAAVVDVSSQEAGYEGHLAIDGDPKTMWHTAWSAGTKQHPHHITIRLKEPVKMTGITYQPRPDQDNGCIGRYEIHVGMDGENWGEKVAAGKFNDGREPQAVRFSEPRVARYVRLTSLDALNGKPHTAVAEMTVVTEGE